MFSANRVTEDRRRPPSALSVTVSLRCPTAKVTVIVSRVMIAVVVVPRVREGPLTNTPQATKLGTLASRRKFGRKPYVRRVRSGRRGRKPPCASVTRCGRVSPVLSNTSRLAVPAEPACLPLARIVNCSSRAGSLTSTFQPYFGAHFQNMRGGEQEDPARCQVWDGDL